MQMTGISGKKNESCFAYSTSFCILVICKEKDR